MVRYDDAVQAGVYRHVGALDRIDGSGCSGAIRLSSRARTRCPSISGKYLASPTQ
jgi:hypothetical protein